MIGDLCPPEVCDQCDRIRRNRDEIHVLEWSESRAEWWVTTYDSRGATAGRPLDWFLDEGNEPDGK